MLHNNVFLPRSCSIDITQQLLFQNVFTLLVLLRALIGTVVLPPYDLFALSTAHVPDHMASRGHVTLAGFALLHIDDAVEEVGFPVLAPEILRDSMGQWWRRGVGIEE